MTGDSSAVINNTEGKIAKCGINPAKIKTIWDPHFQNTLLSTREFEERISWIHRSAKNDILDLYINNPDKDLSYIDSLAAGKIIKERKIHTIGNQFLSFASRHDGKIKNGNKQFDKLKEYYHRKATAAIDKNNLDVELNKMANTSQFAAMNRENIFLQFDIKDRKRQKRNKDLFELRQKLFELIFPFHIWGPK